MEPVDTASAVISAKIDAPKPCRRFVNGDWAFTASIVCDARAGLGSPASERVDHGRDITKWVQDGAGSAVCDVFANLCTSFIWSS